MTERPTDLTATVVDGGIQLKWRNAVGVVIKYVDVYRNGMFLINLMGNVESYLDTNVVDSVTYGYYVSNFVETNMTNNAKATFHKPSPSPVPTLREVVLGDSSIPITSRALVTNGINYCLNTNGGFHFIAHDLTHTLITPDGHNGVARWLCYKGNTLWVLFASGGGNEVDLQRWQLFWNSAGLPAVMYLVWQKQLGAAPGMQPRCMTQLADGTFMIVAQPLVFWHVDADGNVLDKLAADPPLQMHNTDMAQHPSDGSVFTFWSLDTSHTLNYCKVSLNPLKLVHLDTTNQLADGELPHIQACPRPDSGRIAVACQTFPDVIVSGDPFIRYSNLTVYSFTADGPPLVAERIDAKAEAVSSFGFCVSAGQSALAFQPFDGVHFDNMYARINGNMQLLGRPGASVPQTLYRGGSRNQIIACQGGGKIAFANTFTTPRTVSPFYLGEVHLWIE
jgi:hypothetical protein